MSLLTTRALVLKQTRYSESSLVVSVYTEKKGLLSIFVKGVLKNKPAVSPALLQALTVLDLVLYYKENAKLHHVKELKGLMPYTSLPFDIRKSTMAIFINEILIKSLREEEPNPSLFDFLLASLQILDLSQEPVSNYHYWFTLQLTRFLGFLPNPARPAGAPYFDLLNGRFSDQLPPHPHYLDAMMGVIFTRFSQPGFRDYQDLALDKEERKRLTRGIIEYYQLHLQGFGKVNSHEVLEEVLA